MHYDTLHRHNQALGPNGLTTISTVLHALNAAVDDCRRAAKPIDHDAAVLLLIQQLAEVSDLGDISQLRARCADERAALIASPALLAIAGHHVGNDPVAKRTFHVQARRALAQFAEAFGLAPADHRIVVTLGADHEDGMTEFRHDAFAIRVVPYGFLPRTEISLFRCVNGQPAGRSSHAPIDALIDPSALGELVEARLAVTLTACPLAA